MYWTLELASYLEDAPWPAAKDELIDFHWDDDFVWHHPRLAKSLINWRKIRNLPTQMFSNDELVGAFGNFEGVDDEE